MDKLRWRVFCFFVRVGQWMDPWWEKEKRKARRKH